jgi:single-strand DNA-binding protein
MRYMPDGTAVTNFSLAANRRWNDANGERQEETTWFRVSIWGRQAETAHEYVVKGRQVMVEGRLRPDPATGGPKMFTRQDGTVGATYEVVADRYVLLGSRADGAGAVNGEEYHAGSAAQDDSDIPF